MGVIWLGGAAIRARYASRVLTKVLMQANTARKPSICARC